MERRFEAGDRIRLVSVTPHCEECKRMLNAIATVVSLCDDRRIEVDIYAQSHFLPGPNGGQLWAEEACVLVNDGNEATSWSEVEKLTGWKPQKVKV